MTPLQLAQAYGVIASGGLHRPVSLLRRDQQPIARRVISEQTADDVLTMLEAVVSSEAGTGKRAAVPGYRVAGKTGTARKIGPQGYSDEHHTALFAGVAPVSEPRLVVVVIVDDPSNGQYYGGEVAAPVFSRVTQGALRILAVPPDNLPRPDRIGPRFASGPDEGTLR